MDEGQEVPMITPRTDDQPLNSPDEDAPERGVTRHPSHVRVPADKVPEPRTRKDDEGER